VIDNDSVRHALCCTAFGRKHDRRAAQVDYESMWNELKDQLSRDRALGFGHKANRAWFLMEEYEKRAAQSAEVRPNTVQQATNTGSPKLLTLVDIAKSGVLKDHPALQIAFDGAVREQLRAGA